MTEQTNVNINIKKFQPKSMKEHCVVLFIGKRNTGKSFLIKDILYHHQDRFPVGQVVSKTDHLSKFFEKFIPSMVIYKDYQSSILDKLFKRQSRALAGNWKNPNAFVIFDDCLSDKSWQKDNLVRSLFMEGRHSKITFFLGIQAPNEIPPSFRTNIDYIFIFRNNNLADRERIYKNYAGMMEYDLFKRLMDVFTENFGALVIDCTTVSNKLEDQVFYYKAEDHPNLRLCSDRMWEENNLNYESQPVSHLNAIKYQGRKGTYSISRGD